MKHNAFTALSMAAALVVAGSAGASEFSIDFEDVSGTPYAPTAANGWTVQQDDASAVVATNNTRDVQSAKSLKLDTGDDELVYTPTSQDVSVLTMDVCFVGADEAPTVAAGAQTMVYLDVSQSTTALKAYVGGSWTNLATGIVDGSWHTLGMTFDYTAKTVDFSLDGNPVATGVSMGAGSTFTKVNSVGFKGTGLVDNFVGEKAGPEVYWTNGSTTNTMAVTVSGTGTVNAEFPASNNGDSIRFVRVFNGDTYVTLRCPGSSAQEIQLPNNFGTPTKVMAFYGEGVSATEGISPTAESVTVNNGTVSVAFAAKSGVYYWLKDVSANSTLATTPTAVAPNAEGEITLTFSADSTAWGVKKFKLMASDDAPAAPSGN